MTETLNQVSPPLEQIAEVLPLANEQAVRATDPAVIMDIRLGKLVKPGEVLEVDYPALRSTLDSVGAPGDNSGLIIEYQPQLPEDDASGLFMPDGPDILDSDELKPTLTDRELEVISTSREVPTAVIGYGGEMSLEETQKTLQHELKHYADYVINPKKFNHSVGYKVGFKASDMLDNPKRLAAGAAVVVGSPTGALAFAKFSPIPPGLSLEAAERLTVLLEHASLVPSLLALGFLATSALYSANASERSARKAEKIELPDVLTRQQHQPSN